MLPHREPGINGVAWRWPFPSSFRQSVRTDSALDFVFRTSAEYTPLRKAGVLSDLAIYSSKAIRHADTLAKKGFIENLARDCGRDDRLTAGMMVGGVTTAVAEGGYFLPVWQKGVVDKRWNIFCREGARESVKRLSLRIKDISDSPITISNNKVNNKTNYGKHRFETVRYQERT